MDQLKRESPIVVCEIFKLHRYNKIAYSKVTGMGDFASNAMFWTHGEWKSLHYKRQIIINIFAINGFYCNENFLNKLNAN